MGYISKAQLNEKRRKIDGNKTLHIKLIYWWIKTMVVQVPLYFWLSFKFTMQL